MTVKELIERDFKKSVIALKNAEKRPNVPELELEHLRELVNLRKQILERIGVE